MTWRRTATGWMSSDGTWRVRGPLMGRPVFWLYRVGVGRYTPTGRYQDATRYPTAAAAKREAERLAAAEK